MDMTDLLLLFQNKNVNFILNLDLPYDRTGLSKGSDPTKPPGPIRDQDWFTKNGV